MTQPTFTLEPADPRVVLIDLLNNTPDEDLPSIEARYLTGRPDPLPEGSSGFGIGRGFLRRVRAVHPSVGVQRLMGSWLASGSGRGDCWSGRLLVGGVAPTARAG